MWDLKILIQAENFTDRDVVVRIDVFKIKSLQDVFTALWVTLKVSDIFISLTRSLKIPQEKEGRGGKAVVVWVDVCQPSVPAGEQEEYCATEL